MNYKYPSPDPQLYKALIASYFRCLENKPHVKKTSFHLTFERTIHELALDIQNRTYHPGLSNIFVVTHPKPREVIAANLRDRIVHHYIYDYMAPYWERRFVPNSYACRTGKGPLKASEDLRLFIRRHNQHRGAPLFYLQLDVQNFFPSIDLNILYGLVAKHLENEHYLWLCKTVIFHRATTRGNFKLTSPKALWERLPRYKSLFAAATDKGLPIGNLTSQFFANVYMNQLDQFIAHRLKGRFLFWQRYVDDVLFLGEDVEKLKSIVPQVQEFLGRELKMTLNVKKTQLQPLSRGLDHLGYWHKPDHQLVRQRVVSNCKVRVAAYRKEGKGPVDAKAVCSALNSYMGYFRQAASRKLRKHLADEVVSAEIFAGKIMTNAAATKLLPVKDPAVLAARATKEKALRAEFCESFIGGADDGARTRLMHKYLRRWRSMSDILEAAEDHFRDSPASHADVPPSKNRCRSRRESVEVFL